MEATNYPLARLYIPKIEVLSASGADVRAYSITTLAMNSSYLSILHGNISRVRACNSEVPPTLTLVMLEL